ncbi:MAG: histidine phosphatase family protein [Mesorhizobium amorphae]|nr:MAG: histidine phosphatase family protein [Mesorhizobium amorphae]
MASLLFITHPEVVVDPATPIERWHLSPAGITRMRHFSGSPVPADVRAIWSSAETKAIEAAGILGGALGLGVQVAGDLGENDRSATGFLPPADFEATADVFFASPASSIRGWERAVDAQARICAAVARIVAGHDGGDLAIVAHGAVGTLLFCALSRHGISRSFDQPFQGHYWRAPLPDLVPEHGWVPIASR